MSTPPLLRQQSGAPTGRRVSWDVRPGKVLLAVVCAVGVWVTQRVFVQSARGQAWDEKWRNHIVTAAEPVWDSWAHDFGVVSLQLGLLLCLVLALVVAARRRPDLFVRAALLVAGANATTQILKHAVIERPGYVGFGPNALPSGHVTLVASVVFAALLVLSAAWRPLVTLIGGAWIVAVALATIVSGWHRPSDTVAAVLVCLGWASLVSAVRVRRWPDGRGPART